MFENTLKLNRPFWHHFAAFNGEGDEGGAAGGGAGDEGESENGGEEEQKPPAKTGGDDEATKAMKALEKKLAAQQKQLDSYKKKEQDEANSKKTVEERKAELEAENKKLQRENLLTRVALKKGFDVDLLNRVQGETEEEIEADMDLLLGKMAKPEQKSGQGGGTETTSKPAGKDGKPDSRPYLVRLGLVPEPGKQAV